jgi:hypothetical protein
MNDAIDEILNSITLPSAQIPIMPGTVSPPVIGLTATGFTALSFYGGYLEVTFTIPDGQNYAVTLTDLRINSIRSSGSSYTLNSGNRTATARFLLDDQTLTNSFALSISYTASGISGLPGALNTKIAFSGTEKLKSVKGVTFSPVNNSLGAGDADDIDPGLPSEFVQAVIKNGSITLDTSDALQGINLDMSGLNIRQQDNGSAPSYTENGRTETLNAGLNLSWLPNTVTASLAGQKLNRNEIKIRGSYKLSVADQANTEITFNENGALELNVSFDMESFSAVYINGRQIIDDFNGSQDSTFDLSLGDLGQTVTSIKITEVGAELTFRPSPISGLNLTIKAPKFNVDKTHPVAAGANRFTSELPFDYDLTDTKNSTVEFELLLSSSGSAASVLKLTDITLNQEVTIIDCTPKAIFEWDRATINPQAAAGDNDFTKGTFPGKNDAPFSLAGNDLEDILKTIQFDNIKGYLFFSGPELASGNNINLKLQSFPKSSSPEYIYGTSAGGGAIEFIQTVLKMPEEGKPFTENIDTIRSSTGGFIDFTSTFNRMLDGDPLSIEYEMDFGNGLIITKDQVFGENGVSVFKADLVIVVPLKLTPEPGQAAEIDVTKYMGDMIGKNLLDFTEDMGEGIDISFNTLTLNIGLTGAPMEGGSLVIERDAGKDGAYGADAQVPPISFDGKDISIHLAPYLGDSRKFTLKGIKLRIEDGGYLQVPRGFSLVNLNVNAGVDVTYNF